VPAAYEWALKNGDMVLFELVRAIRDAQAAQEGA
jgi:hypothetical protein